MQCKAANLRREREREKKRRKKKVLGLLRELYLSPPSPISSNKNNHVIMENQFFDRYFFTDITCCLSDVNITVNRQRQKQRQRQMTFELTSNTFGLDIIKIKGQQGADDKASSLCL